MTEEEKKSLEIYEQRRTDRISFLKKKNTARKLLNDKGFMKREGENTFSNYTYFSEAQYKKLFTELFSKAGLEMSCDEVEVTQIQGTAKAPFGRFVKLRFILTDIETGYEEATLSTGEGFDNGDKALYKAKTGALKYWLASNWMVATGDDPEKDSPGEEEKPKKATTRSSAKTAKTENQATAAQIVMIQNLYTSQEIQTMLGRMNPARTSLEQISVREASQMIASRKGA